MGDVRLRPQWEIDAIDAAEDAREQRRTRARFLSQAGRLFWFFEGPKVKKGRGQRRNRRNRRC